MNFSGIPIGSVVVGVDGSHHGDHAVDWAARHAANESRPLVLVNAVDSTTAPAAWMTQGGIDPTPYLEQADAAATLLLHAARQRALAIAGGLAVKEYRVRCDPRTALIDASEGAQTLVVGSRGLGPVQSMILGSVGAAVVRRASCPVVVVRPHHPGLVRRGVLVGADGTAGSLPVLDFAFRQASELRLPLTVAYVVLDVGGTSRNPEEFASGDPGYDDRALTLSETLVGLAEKYPEVSVSQHLVRGLADGSLLALADSMDLVVVGHHRQDLARRLFFSSVALGVVEHAATVVAVVPED